MEPSREDLLSALREAEEFISVTLSNETLSYEAERKRQQLKVRLESLTGLGSKPLILLPQEVPVSSQDGEEEEFYDDVQQGGQDHSVATTKLEGFSNESEDNVEQLEYEYMCEKDKKEETEDFYDDTVPDESKNVPSTNEVQTTEDTNYEIAETQNQIPNDNDENEDDDFYDGVESPSDDKKSLDLLETRERSATEELESLAKPVKPEDVDEVVMKGQLEKHRKKGIYIGSKWQKRHCVVRRFVMYYFMGTSSTAQKGTIILPGYKATAHRSNKTNGKEFILTRDEDRSYIFMAESKEIADKWINAITKAANTTEISKRQSEIIDNLRSVPGGDEEDTSSLCYDDDNDSITTVPETPPAESGEIYDDVIKGEADEVSANADDINYEIAGVTDTQEDDSDPELYEAPVEEIQPEAPPLHPKPGAMEFEEFYEMPEETKNNNETLTTSTQPPPEPRRSPQPPVEIPTVTEEDEEIYDDIVLSPPEPTPPVVDSKPPLPDRSKPQALTNGQKPSPPLTPRLHSKMPLPPTPQEAESPKPAIPPRRSPAPQKKTESEAPAVEEPSPTEVTAKSKGAPPPPPDVTVESKGPPPPLPDVTVESKSPPPPPPEEEPEQQVIDYKSVYQALWDCKPDADDELEFRRGDLIYIYEKPHSDWWIGSRYKPQGYETRLIPCLYLTEAFNL